MIPTKISIKWHYSRDAIYRVSIFSSKSRGASELTLLANSSMRANTNNATLEGATYLSAEVKQNRPVSELSFVPSHDKNALKLPWTETCCGVVSVDVLGVLGSAPGEMIILRISGIRSKCQIAIEQSINSGYGGKLHLATLGGSPVFHRKMGFAALYAPSNTQGYDYKEHGDGATFLNDKLDECIKNGIKYEDFGSFPMELRSETVQHSKFWQVRLQQPLTCSTTNTPITPCVRGVTHFQSNKTPAKDDCEIEKAMDLIANCPWAVYP